MSQFSYTSPIDRVRRGTGSDLTRTDPGSLGTPGIAITPPVSEGAAMLEQVLGVLNAAGNTAGTVGYFARSARIEQEQDAREAAAEQRRLDAEAARYDAGLAGKAIDQDLVRDLESVTAGKFDGDGRDIPAILNPIIATRTQGQSQAYADAYNAGYRDQMENALRARRAALIEKHRADLNELGARAALTTDPGQMDGLLADYRKNNPNSTDLEARSAIIVPALKYAGSTGNTARVEALSGLLGNEFALEKTRAAVDAKDFNERKAEEDYRDLADSLLKRFELGEPPTAVRADVRSALESGRLTASRAAALNDRIDSELARQQREIAKTQAATIKLQEEAAAVADADKLLSQGRLQAVEDRTYTLPDGTEKTIKAKEVQTAVMAREMDRIDQTSRTPQEAFARKVEWAGLQGVWPEQWARDMNIGAVKASIDTLIPAPGKPLTEAVSADVLKGFDAYRTMRAMNPTLAKKIVNDDDANALYELADAAMSLPQYANPRDALIVAGKVLASPVKGAGVSPQLVQDKADEIGDSIWPWKQDPINTSYVAETLGQYARIYHGLTANPAMALDAAEKSFRARHFQFNGQWLPNNQVDGVSAEDVVRRAADSAFEQYIEKKPAGEQVSKDDLTFMSDGQGGFFIATKKDGEPVEGWNTAGLGAFTMNDLRRLDNERDEFKAAKDARIEQNKASAAKAIAMWDKTSARMDPFTKSAKLERLRRQMETGIVGPDDRADARRLLNLATGNK